MNTTKPAGPETGQVNKFPPMAVTGPQEPARIDEVKSRQQVMLDAMAAVPAIPPGGSQSISFNMNAPDPNLTFKHWAARGIATGLGNMIAFPFKLMGGAITAIVMSAITLIKWALIIIAVPTLIMIGMRLKEQMEVQPDVRTGTAAAVLSGKDFIDGAADGINDARKAPPRPNPTNKPPAE